MITKYEHIIYVDIDIFIIINDQNKYLFNIFKYKLIFQSINKNSI